MRCIGQDTKYQTLNTNSTMVYCNGTGTIFVDTKKNFQNRIQADTDEYNGKYVNTFLTNSTESALTAIPAYSK